MIIKKGIKGKNKGGILSILSICMSVLVLSLGSLYFATDKFGIEMCIFHLSSASFPEIQSTQIRYFRAGISAL